MQRFPMGRFCCQPSLLAVRGHPPGVGGFEGVFSNLRAEEWGATHNTIKLLNVVETFELRKEFL